MVVVVGCGCNVRPHIGLLSYTAYYVYTEEADRHHASQMAPCALGEMFQKTLIKNILLSLTGC